MAVIILILPEVALTIVSPFQDFFNKDTKMKIIFSSYLVGWPG
jgi:Na+-transporting NADH:ubiquinone oxidoreductase subunit NqrF